jgi:acylglycerol lipase
VIKSAVTGTPSGAVDGSFITRDGLTLSSYRLSPRGPALAPVILVHGQSDHARALPYVRLATSLAGQGFEVFAFDRRGSGHSQGIANYTESWSDLRDDLSRFVDLVEDRCGRLPFLVGLSFGGLQIVDFAIESPDSVPGCVALAPALDAGGSSIWLRRSLPLLMKIMPMYGLDPKLDESTLTHDPELCRQYRADPLWRPKTTPSLAVAALDAIDRVSAKAGRLRQPLLVIHGTADRVVPIQGTRNVFPRFGSEDKTFLEMPGAFHALPIEPSGDEICVHIANWLTLRAKPL